MAATPPSPTVGASESPAVEQASTFVSADRVFIVYADATLRYINSTLEGIKGVVVHLPRIVLNESKAPTKRTLISLSPESHTALLAAGLEGSEPARIKVQGAPTSNAPKGFILTIQPWKYDPARRGPAAGFKPAFFIPYPRALSVEEAMWNVDYDLKTMVKSGLLEAGCWEAVAPVNRRSDSVDGEAKGYIRVNFNPDVPLSRIIEARELMNDSCYYPSEDETGRPYPETVPFMKVLWNRDLSSKEEKSRREAKRAELKEGKTEVGGRRRRAPTGPPPRGAPKPTVEGTGALPAGASWARHA